MVGVLAGGPSNERDISLKSGKAVYNALISEGIDAIFIDVYDNIHDIIKNNKIDVAFIALHGRFGEDGTVQRILESAGIPYTGSGPNASRIALDKIASKEIFKTRNIPTPEYVVLEKIGFSIKDAAGLGLPLVVKPQFEGSSIGLSVVKEEKDLKWAIDKAFEFGPKALLEKYVEGRELTVGILDDKALPVIEIVPKDRVYDYKAKYSDPNTQYLVPAPINEDAFVRAKELGLKAHTGLGCRGFSRVDMMMDKDGNIFVLEVNTIPGMTERSLLPKAASAIGLNFSKLCIKLIENALKH
jgi:D-alanine-D-alanine ligase